MLRRANIRSIAKINLDLRVLNKRDDGFHEIRTVFQTISLCDTIGIEFERARRTKLEIDDALNIPDNLILRAAMAALDAMKVRARVRFRLNKSIPIGGGLGGGSSNAASILLALPALAGKRLPFEKLADIGAGLGSDVPFFLTGGTALGIGRGTEIYPLADIAEEHMLVIAPGIHVATGPAYEALNRLGAVSAPGVKSPARGLTSPDLSHKINNFQSFVRALAEMRSAKEASVFCANDFEPIVFDRQPELHAMFRGLLRAAARSSEIASGRVSKTSRGEPGANGVRMTGSGSALFALFRSEAERDLALRLLQKEKGFEEFGVDSEGSPQGVRRIVRATLVSRRRYRRMWLKQLAEHVIPEKDIWPPQSRYER